MKKRLLFLAALLMGVSTFSGCALFPFIEDVNFWEKKDEPQILAKDVTPTPSPVPTATPTPTPSPIPTLTPDQIAHSEVLQAASDFAVQYDYLGAIQYLKNQGDYTESKALQDAVVEYQATLAECKPYPLEEITHVFFHTLVVDNAKAFDGDEHEAGYNQYMTTIPEFNKMIETMYEKGYVMVSPHDMAAINENGVMERGEILLPPGKIPFVLSQDDVSYYHYMKDDGFATRLLLDENGEVKCEYIEDDGTVSIGDYDMVPLIDSFVKEHPDFSYKGRKGILAMTGYDGLLGYRTDIAYYTWENLQDDQLEFLESHPEFNFEEEKRQAKEVADAMKATGWEFASHTWGHKNVTVASVEELESDTYKFKTNCEPILGFTDMIIFAFGADIGNWEPYTYENPKFTYYKEVGYNYFMNVDSSQYWLQISDSCFRQGRRNLDGYRMFYNPEMLSDLFNVEDVWDNDRPTPVPPI